MKTTKIIFVFFFLMITIKLSFSQIAFAYAKNNNNEIIAYSIDFFEETALDCYKKAEGVLRTKGYTKTGYYSSSLKKGVYTVIESEWKPFNRDNTMHSYGFGVGSTKAESLDAAIKNLKTFHWWEPSHGYKQVESNYYTNSFQKNSDNELQTIEEDEDSGGSDNGYNTSPNNESPAYNQVITTNTQNEYQTNTTNQPKSQEQLREEHNQRVYEKGIRRLEQIDREAQMRRQLVSEGSDDLMQAFDPNMDNYSKGMAVTQGATKVLAGAGVNPYVSAGVGAIAGILVATHKTAEEKEAERIQLENERLIKEYMYVLNKADSLFLVAEQSDKYEKQLYLNAKNEYAKIANHKFASSYPSDMIGEINYFIETQQIKDAMFSYVKALNKDFNKNYLSERAPKIYFYFVSFNLLPNERYGEIMFSNIFPIYFNQKTNSWPYAPEIKSKIKLEYQEELIIKGYFMSLSEAEKSKNELIVQAENSYLTVLDNYYSFDFGNQNNSNSIGNSNQNFWGEEQKSVSQENSTDFWGNPIQKEVSVSSENGEADSTIIENEGYDFWGNPIK